MSGDLLTEQETVARIQNLIGGRTRGTATVGELDARLRWARKVRVGTVALKMALSGEIRVYFIEGQVKVGPRWSVARQPPQETKNLCFAPARPHHPIHSKYPIRLLA